MPQLSVSKVKIVPRAMSGFMGFAGLAGLFCLGTPAMAGDCAIQFAGLQQRMSGFGGSTAWKSGLADSLIARLFSPTQGCGLTLVRMRIGPDGAIGAGELAIAKKAQAHGAMLWAAPWSPPANYKDNNSVNNGGFPPHRPLPGLGG